MQDQDLSPFGRRVTILIGLSVLGIMSAGLALSFYRNVLFEQTLQRVADSNAKLRREIDHATAKLDEYRSSQYRDKAAKESLGLLRPGEKMLVIIPGVDPLRGTPGDELAAQQIREAAFHEYLRRTPTWEHWKLYLFDRAGLEKLRQAFF